MALMIGAFITQLVVPGLVGPLVTPVIIAVLLAAVVWARLSQLRSLADMRRT